MKNSNKLGRLFVQALKSAKTNDPRKFEASKEEFRKELMKHTTHPERLQKLPDRASLPESVEELEEVNKSISKNSLEQKIKTQRLLRKAGAKPNTNAFAKKSQEKPKPKKKDSLWEKVKRQREDRKKKPKPAKVSVKGDPKKTKSKPFRLGN